MTRYYQKDIECAPRETIRALQNERLAETVRRAYERSPYYGKLMREKGVKPGDINSVDDLHKLPFLNKDDLRKAYPYGLLAVPPSEVARIHSTSGTTGKRVIAFYNRHDLDIWSDCCARAITAAGGTAEDVIQISYGYGLFSGGMGIHDGAYKVGALTVPISSGNTDRQLQFMEDLGSTILCCTPSYAAYLAETITERGLRDRIKLKAGIFGAEAWTGEMRRDVEEKLGLKAYDIYGLTEIAGPGVSYECGEQNGMHVNEDHFIAEIVDPDTGEPLPDGEKGELVFTCITKEAFPMIRYRTRDICVLRREKCPCGRTHVKMSKPLGRCDDMLIIKGVNVFPSQIEAVILRHGYPPNYEIEVSRVNNSDILDIYVEMTPDKFAGTIGEISAEEKRLVDKLKGMLGIYAKVHLVAPKTLRRGEGKASRVIDKRGLY